MASRKGEWVAMRNWQWKKRAESSMNWHSSCCRARRQAVFRLVQQVQPILFDALGKVQKGTFPVGMFGQVAHQIFAHIAGLGVTAGHIYRFQPIVVFHGAEMKIRVFGVRYS